MNGQRFPVLALRLLLACALLLAAAHGYGRALVEALMPALGAALRWLADDFRLLSLALVQEGPDTALEARAMLEHTLVLGGRAIVPNGHTGFAVTTTLGTVLQPVLAALVLAMAWPARPLEWLVRLVLTALLLVPVVLVDAPAYLAASLWQMQVRAFEPERVSPLLWWMDFLVGGGRLALGLVAGAIATAASAKFFGRPRVRVGDQM